jgi:hypothetical protein
MPERDAVGTAAAAACPIFSSQHARTQPSEKKIEQWEKKKGEEEPSRLFASRGRKPELPPRCRSCNNALDASPPGGFENAVASLHHARDTAAVEDDEDDAERGRAPTPDWRLELQPQRQAACVPTTASSRAGGVVGAVARRNRRDAEAAHHFCSTCCVRAKLPPCHKLKHEEEK